MLKRLKLAEANILSLAVIALLLFIPLYPKFPLLNVPGTYVAIRVEDLLVAGIVIVWFLVELRQGFPSLQDKVGRQIILYWLIGGLSLTSALLITKNITSHIALLHFIRRLEYMSLFFIALASVKKAENLRSYSLVLLLSTTGVIIYGFGQKYFGWPVVSTMNEEFSKGFLLQLTEWARVSSSFAGHYDLAAYLVLALAAIMGFIIGLKRRITKITIGLIWLFAFYLLVLTASRVSFAAYLMAITLVLLGLKKYWWIGPILAFSLVFMLLSAEISQRFAHTFNIDLSALSGKIKILEIHRAEKIAQRPEPTSTVPVSEDEKKEEVVESSLVSTPTPTPGLKVATSAGEIERWRPTTEEAIEYSSGIRFNVEWPRALRAFAKNPLLGTGYSSVTLATDNDYLRALAETGLLGFLAFGLIFLQIGREVFLYLKKAESGPERALVIGLTGAAIGLLANAIFIDVFEASKVAFIFWVLMGILVGTIRLRPVRARR